LQFFIQQRTLKAQELFEQQYLQQHSILEGDSSLIDPDFPMKVVNLSQLFCKVVDLSDVQNDRQQHLNDLLNFEMDVFDCSNDIKHGLDQFVSDNEGAALQNTQVVILCFLEVDPPV